MSCQLALGSCKLQKSCKRFLTAALPEFHPSRFARCAQHVCAPICSASNCIPDHYDHCCVSLLARCASHSLRTCRQHAGLNRDTLVTAPRPKESNPSAAMFRRFRRFIRKFAGLRCGHWGMQAWEANRVWMFLDGSFDATVQE